MSYIGQHSIISELFRLTIYLAQLKHLIKDTSNILKCSPSDLVNILIQCIKLIGLRRLMKSYIQIFPTFWMSNNGLSYIKLVIDIKHPQLWRNQANFQSILPTFTLKMIVIQSNFHDDWIKSILGPVQFFMHQSLGKIWM